jgi:hypothetical protein
VYDTEIAIFWYRPGMLAKTFFRRQAQAQNRNPMQELTTFLTNHGSTPVSDPRQLGSLCQSFHESKWRESSTVLGDF